MYFHADLAEHHLQRDVTPNVQDVDEGVGGTKGMAPLGVGGAAKAGATNTRAKIGPHKLQSLHRLACSKVHLPEVVSMCFS